MKFPPALSAFAVSAVAGFAAVATGREVFRPSQSSATWKSEPGAGGASEVVMAAKNHPAAPASAPSLAARFRTLLSQLGLDPSWAEGLAADNASGFPDLLRRIKALPEAQSEPLSEVLLGRWAALDPAGGAAFFKSQENGSMRAAFFRQWQRLDFPTAVSRAEELGGEVLTATLRDKALHDPSGLLTWLADRPELNPLSLFNSGDEESAKALIRLAETDPGQMLAWLRQLPERGLTHSLAAELAKHRPEEVLTWAKAIQNPDQSTAALLGVADTLATSQPERALSLLAALPEPENYEDRSRLYGVIQKLDPKNADQAGDLIKKLPPGETRALVMHVALRNLLESDPSAAFALSEAPERGPGVAWLTTDIPLAAQTPEGARRILEAAEGARASSYRETIAGQAMITWMERDPRTLAAWLSEKGDTPFVEAMRESIQTALAVQQRRDGQADPELLDIVGLPPGVLVRSQLLEDPAGAARGLEAVQDPETRQRLAGDLAKQFVSEDRGQAMAWAGTVQDPEVRSIAWKTIAAEWVREDSWQASQWIAGLPEGRGRDSAVLAMAEGISGTDPDLAWKWALSMSDPGLKNEALTTAAQAWARKDAAALQEALRDTALTPSEQQAVWAKLPNRPEAGE